MLNSASDDDNMPLQRSDSKTEQIETLRKLVEAGLMDKKDLPNNSSFFSFRAILNGKRLFKSTYDERIESTTP